MHYDVAAAVNDHSDVIATAPRVFHDSAPQDSFTTTDGRGFLRTAAGNADRHVEIATAARVCHLQNDLVHVAAAKLAASQSVMLVRNARLAGALCYRSGNRVICLNCRGKSGG